MHDTGAAGVTARIRTFPRRETGRRVVLFRAAQTEILRKGSGDDDADVCDDNSLVITAG